MLSLLMRGKLSNNEGNSWFVLQVILVWEQTISMYGDWPYRRDFSSQSYEIGHLSHVCVSAFHRITVASFFSSELQRKLVRFNRVCLAQKAGPIGNWALLLLKRL